MTAYHPHSNPSALPPVTNAEQVRTLPWGGNAWWDVPIMLHVEKFARDPAFPRDEREKAMVLAGYLMTGENCEFTADYTFDDWMNENCSDA